MDRFNIPLVAEGLTAYAIEWQNGFERSSPSAYTPTWAETRRLWTDAILQGIARLECREPDSALMEQFDRQLEQARGSFATAPASPRLQKETIRSLRNFVRALESAGDDHRRQIAMVGDLLEDMVVHLPWDSRKNGVYTAGDEAESALVRLTAQMPIRFSRVLLGWETGPCISGFVSGAVRDADAVRETALYNEASRQYPEVSDWPTLCVTYAGGNRETALGTIDATEFDLRVMNRTGDRFLDRLGIRWLGGPYELTVTIGPAMTRMQM